MNQHISSYLFLLSGLLVVVTAEPTATATILTPEADRKEGGQVHMRCIATNLDSDLHTGWMTEDPVKTLRWDNYTLTTEQRFTFTTTTQPSGQTIQDFTIFDLQRSDSDEYVCNVHNLSITSGNRIVALDRVKLSVLYFPTESFPMCSTDGPITLDIGAEINMQCSSENGNLAIQMDVYPIPTSNCYLWRTSNVDHTIFGSLDLTVDVNDNGTSFECVISSQYFPRMRSSCIMGPIFVKPGPITSDKRPSSIPWIASFVVTLILLVLSCVVNILVICRNVKLKRDNRSLTEQVSSLSKADPYMELQLTDDRNREYMEPEARAQHTYCQTIQTDTDNPGDDYEPTSGNDKYEVVGLPQNN